MNSKGTKKEPLVRRRGFYVALYSCLAVLLVLAAVISYNNYSAVTRAKELRAQLADDELQQASASTYQSYLTPEDTSQPTNPSATRQTPAAGSATQAPSGSGTPSPARGTTPSGAGTSSPSGTGTTPSGAGTTPSGAGTTPGGTGTGTSSGASSTGSGTQTPGTQTPAGGTGTPAPQSSPSRSGTAVTPQSDTEQDKQQTSPDSSQQAESEENADDETAKTSTGPISPTRSTFSPPLFEEYVQGDTMSWPVLGEIVMDYSMDRVVYDKTLEQYRANDVMCIATELGTPVYAATGGVVVSVENTRESGNTVVIEHGNGWATTYSQLQDGVLVKPGDIVTEGQVIGGVGSPTLYYVLLGNHLGFSVTHDENYLDPKTILE